MEAFVDYVVRRMVSEPDAVRIETQDQGGSTIYGMRVAPSDVGKVIGRKGATINALRALVQTGGAKMGRRCTVELLED
jgi:uncharacterized protein